MTAIFFFASVLLHELGHSVVAQRFRISVKSITLFIFGGVAQIAGEPPGASAELLIAAAGPLTSFALSGVFYLVAQAVAGITPALAAAKYLAYVNVVLAGFNLIRLAASPGTRDTMRQPHEDRTRAWQAWRTQGQAGTLQVLRDGRLGFVDGTLGESTATTRSWAGAGASPGYCRARKGHALKKGEQKHGDSCTCRSLVYRRPVWPIG